MKSYPQERNIQLPPKELSGVGHSDTAPVQVQRNEGFSDVISHVYFNYRVVKDARPWSLLHSPALSLLNSYLGSCAFPGSFFF